MISRVNAYTLDPVWDISYNLFRRSEKCDFASSIGSSVVKNNFSGNICLEGNLGTDG